MLRFIQDHVIIIHSDNTIAPLDLIQTVRTDLAVHMQNMKAFDF